MIKDHIKMKVVVFYKQNNQFCEWITQKPKNLKLIWSVVKHWEKYNPFENNKVGDLNEF